MHLSIHLIYAAIQTPDSLLMAEGEVMLDIAGVRRFAPDNPTLADDVLYVLTEAEADALPSDRRLHLLCLGQPALGLRGEICRDAISMPAEGDPANILTRVQDVFDGYARWQEDVNDAVLSGQSLQSILDQCSRLLTNPIALFDNSQTLLMWSGVLPENTAGSLWEFVLLHGYSPEEPERELLSQLFRSRPRPFYYRSPDRYRNINRLVAGLTHQGVLLGCLGLSDISAPITAAEYAHLCLIQAVMAKALPRSREFNTQGTELPWYLAQLLSGRTVSRSLVSYQLSLVKRRMDDPYVLWCLTPADQRLTDQPDLRAFLPSVSRQFKTDRVYGFEHAILVCDYQLDHSHEAPFQVGLASFLSVAGLKAAFSMVFEDIFDIRQAYAQCKLALDHEDPKDGSAIRDYRAHYASHLLRSLTATTDWDGLLYPRVRNLLTKDAAYGRELLRCLQAYLFHGRNVSATAKSLFIHRHTAIYRIDQIAQITGIDLASLDEDSLLQIYLSCRLLLAGSDRDALLNEAV